MKEIPDYLKLWGKADRDAEGNLIRHPLAYHMLDVAAVAYIWLKEDEELRNIFIRKSGIPEESILGITTLAVALHDIGKATVYFQNKIPEISKENSLYHELAANTPGFDHGAFGCLWLAEWRNSEKEFQDWASNFPFLQTTCFLHLWESACWHHGKTYSGSDLDSFDPTEPKPKGRGDSFDLVVKLRNETLRFIIQSIVQIEKWEIEDRNVPLTPSFIRLFAGFVSVCDWIGSNTEFFPYPIEKFDYWNYAKEQAKLALEDIKIYGKKTEPMLSFKEILDSGKSPRPIQKALENANVPNSSLIIVEAPTGEGKTETALFQYSRNPGRGFYFGLPTQASANQIYGRIEKFLEEKLGTNEKSILAHGNAWLVKATTESKSYGNKKNTEEITAESELSDWFNSKKRTLLCRFGVGTVDQAMLSVLNVKHGFVKLFGLAGKTLIIDEIHAYDSFMLPIIEHLVRWCGYLETSVVLLSATLPSAMKQRLVTAYLDSDDVLLETLSYPLLTIATKETKTLSQIHSYKNEKIKTRKTELIQYSFLSHEIDSISEVIIKALSRIQNGGNILWICNTVKKAQFVYEELMKQETENLEFRLFHSRFTKIDRLTIEKNIESLYGDESEKVNRPIKSILVATQVAEQSLDIDFDFLITDIAPVDLILQRAGRVFRHNRKNRNVTFTQPEILLLVPNELSTLKNFAGVYDKYTVLKTMYELCHLEGNQINLPSMYRSLVESVYSDSIPEIDEIKMDSITLSISQAKWKEVLKKKLDKMEELDTKGRRNLIPLPTSEDFSESTLLSEEENSFWNAKTRDGEDKIGLILIHDNNGNYTIGELVLPETIPEKIPKEISIAFAQNTVDVGTKGFVMEAKKVQSFVSNHSLLDAWQRKIDKVSQFKGNKFVLMQENAETNINLSNNEYLIEYDSIKGLKVQKQKEEKHGS